MKLNLLNTIKSLLIAALVLTTAAVASYADDNVTYVKCFQRWPWTGEIVIDYILQQNQDNKSENPLFCVDITAQDAVTGEEYVIDSAFVSGDNGSVYGSGKKRAVWDAKANGYEIKTTIYITVSAEDVTPAEEYGPVEDGDSDANEGAFVKFDLATGTVETLDKEPEWTDAEKTTSFCFKKIPAGTFVMGSPESEPGRGSDEKEHVVTITKDFYMSVYELTEAQYAMIMGQGEGDSTVAKGNLSYNELRGSKAGAGFPASNDVDPDSIIGRMRALTGQNVDLPTEAQWEYACKAGTQGTWNDGSAIIGTQTDANLNNLANYKGSGKSSRLYVGTKAPNAWGLYDMHGNAAEWCLDLYGANGSGSEDPVGATKGSKRVVKGGECSSKASECRSASREARNSGSSSDRLGARLVINF